MTKEDDDFRDFSDEGLDDDDSMPSTEELTEFAPRCTDSANTDVIYKEHGRGYRFVIEWGAWLAWDGRRWNRMGAKQRVLHAAMLTARLEHSRCRDRIAKLQEEIRMAAVKGTKDEDLEASLKYEKMLLKWHEQSQNAARLEAAARLLETRLFVQLPELDSDPLLLNVANGTLDLRCAELRPHRQEDLITQIANVEWEEGAPCPTWDRFVREAMGGDLLLQLYLQRLVGYAITGLTTEHILAFFHGGGLNGKSTFVQTIRSMLGEYAAAAPRDLLFEDKNGIKGHPTEFARLYGVRWAVCAEIGEYVTLDEAKVKDLTGGDVISARRMREDFWDLIPTHKLIVSGNHKPTVRGNDFGIWRRIRLIPWLVTVSKEDVDIELPAKLRRELSGILRWAVQGCLEWQRAGMQDPASVLEATVEYREESDAFGAFMTRHMVFEEGGRVSRQAIREVYEKWCTEMGHKPYGPKKVAQRLKEAGASTCSVREMGRVKDGWRGVRMKSDFEMQVEAEPCKGEPQS
jgi:putative DNA primase/helicase